MSGIGIDAAMISNTNPDLKKRVGWLAYVDAGLRAIPASKPFRVVHRIDTGRHHRSRVVEHPRREPRLPARQHRAHPRRRDRRRQARRRRAAAAQPHRLAPRLAQGHLGEPGAAQVGARPPVPRPDRRQPAAARSSTRAAARSRSRSRASPRSSRSTATSSARSSRARRSTSTRPRSSCASRAEAVAAGTTPARAPSPDRRRGRSGRERRQHERIPEVDERPRLHRPRATVTSARPFDESSVS